MSEHNKAQQLGVSSLAPRLGASAPTVPGCYVARVISAAALFCLLAIPVALADGPAPETLRFMVYRDAAEIESEVSARQQELGAPSVHYSVSIYFGTEVEWQNACSWLESQRENATRVYVPVQSSVPEKRYYCLYWRQQSNVSAATIFEDQTFIEEFVENFGGSPGHWSFLFED